MRLRLTPALARRDQNVNNARTLAARWRTVDIVTPINCSNSLLSSPGTPTGILPSLTTA